ncbi:kinase-like domain-containing protein [Zychaea mexicana]|uniref:kinase-like domain-containing protein n=1 Tax=Zychaea mexicana TaxID=64656 RepID=UPI0022FE9769|nr:kinase-like domain-containing protein [Zychaea mexicana]KAI9477072.1 kinase-like domain-containing protein [Zychaea mexicana]
MDTISKGVETLITRWPSGKKRSSKLDLTSTSISNHERKASTSSVSSVLSAISRTLSVRSSISELSLQDKDSLVTPIDSPRATSPAIGSNNNNHHHHHQPLSPPQQQQKIMTPPPSVPASPVTSPVATPAKAQSLPPPSSPLDSYIIRETLGTGQFGRVHLAQSRTDRQYYAIKTLDKHDVVRLRQTQHINNEQAILCKVNHPFLVNLVESFQDDSHLFFVMEYVQGGELFRILRQEKQFSEEITKFYAAEPENILLDSDGHVKLVDFGFAKKVPDITWTVCGTPDYFAPEIIKSKGYSKAVDWWGLGVLIYEMLVGKSPFTDKNPVDMYQNILDCRVSWPEHISPVAKDLLLGLLTPDITRRYGNLKDGSRDIKEHPFFEGIDFDKIARREVSPPFRPNIKGEGDTTCFENYEEPDVPYGLHMADPYQSQFPNFTK